MLFLQISVGPLFFGGVMYVKIYNYEAKLEVLFQIWIFVFKIPPVSSF